MTTHRPRLSRRTASRMLDDPTAGTEPLSRLLAAAAAPAQATELSREELAVAGFQAGGSLDPIAASRSSSLFARARKLIAAPAVALAAAGVLVAGGSIAFAASQGALHVPFDGHDNRSDKAPSAPSSTNPGLTHSGGPATGTPSGLPTPSSTHTPGASPSPSLEGLCRAFQAGAVDVNHANPAFGALTAAAGGKENIGAYCVDLIGPSKKPTHPVTPPHPTPTHPAKPTPTHTKPTHTKPTQAASPTLPSPSRRPTKPAH